MGNLSGVTTYSEVFSESKILDCLENRSSFLSSSHRNIICSNNNELISRSSKITQELELRLKERRIAMESNTDKFYPKILHQSDLTQSLNIPHGRNSSISTHSSSNSEASSNDLDALGIIRKLNSKSANSLNAGSSVSQLSVSCVCPCHSHSHNQSHSHNNSNSHCHMQSNNKNSKSEASPNHTFQHKCHQQKNHTITNILPSSIKAKTNESLSTSYSSNSSPTTTVASQVTSSKPVRINAITNNNANKYKKPKIVLDGSATLPTKRESIRMLMENKAVSENKQKNALEMHLNTMIGIRASTNNLNSLNE